MSDQPKKKEARYELVEVPESLGPVEVVVDDYAIKRFAFTQDDYGPWYFGQSPFGRRIGHAGLLANDILSVFYSKYDRNTVVGVHTEEELWFLEPVFVDERVTITGCYVDKYVKRDQGYVAMEAEATAQDGRVLMRHRGVEIMRVAPGEIVGRRLGNQPRRRVTGEILADAPPVGRARRGLAPRTPIVPLLKLPRAEQVSVYSFVGEYQRNIHNDLEIARSGGLEAPIIQGQQQTCYVLETMTTLFGASWFTSGWLKLRFINPAHPGSPLTVRGATLGESTTGTNHRLELEVWIERADGIKTAVGWAAADIEDDASPIEDDA